MRAIGPTLRWLAYVLLAVTAAAPARAANTFNLSEGFCVLATEAALSPDEVIARQGSFDCGRGRFKASQAHVWLLANLRAEPIPPGPLRIESDIAPIDSALIHIRFRDGSTSTKQFVPSDIAHNWAAGTRFSVPLGNGDRSPDLLLVRVDRPWSASTLSTAELLTEEVAARQHMTRMLLFAMYCGFAILPILYSGAFFAVLRYRFILLHALMSIAIVAYTFASSNLILHFFPDTTLWLRTWISYCSLAAAGGFACFFVPELLEQGMIGRRLHRALAASGALLFAVCVFMVAWAPGLPLVARNIYNAAFLPSFITVAAATLIAWRNGSRAANFLLVGWTAIFVIGLDRVARGMDLYVAPSEVDFSLYYALAFEAVVTAFAVADRMMSLRRERDRALLRAAQLARLAETDDLTNLYNRRTLETRFGEWRQQRRKCSLALIDIDHFKRVNDTHGHIVGDRVLRAVAEALRDHAGENAVAARVGGEEFAVLYATENPRALAGRLSALRTEITRHVARTVPELSHRITISAGAVPVEDRDFDSARGEADALLYEAKRSGRDRAELPSAERAAA